MTLLKATILVAYVAVCVYLLVWVFLPPAARMLREGWREMRMRCEKSRPGAEEGEP